MSDEFYSISNHQQLDSLFKSLFRLATKNLLQLHQIHHLQGNLPVDDQWSKKALCYCQFIKNSIPDWTAADTTMSLLQ